MTKRLYYDSAYLTEWETEIIETVVREDGIYVILKETAFYPHGGGQPCDKGYIQGVPVIDVITESELILHKLESLPEERKVICRIDWTRRFDHMQQHSGQHLLSAVCLDMYQAKTLSFHLGMDYCTIDVEASELTSSQLEAIEHEVNQQIYQNHSIISYMVTEQEVNQLELVKQTSLTDNIRIVEIKNIEHNACGGTHVSSTGAIGMIKLLKSEKHKGNMRIYFKCGNRALGEFCEHQTIVGALSVKFKSSKEDILDRMDKWEKEHKQLQEEIAALKDKYDDYAARELIANKDGALIATVFQDKSLKDLQNLAGKINSQCDAPVLLLTTMENKVLLSQRNISGFSCGAFMKANQVHYNGKGGGSDILAQAAFANEEDAFAFYEFAVRTLQEQFQ
ncbi:alanyl-tRNA editing protein [Paenibacillus marinisediminis]